MAVTNWNLGKKEPKPLGFQKGPNGEDVPIYEEGNEPETIPGLTPQEQKDSDAQIEAANQNAFVPPSVKMQTGPAVPQKGLTSWEQAMANMNARQDSIRQHEEERQAAWHRQNRDARIRRLEGIVGSEGGRYSPYAVADAKRALDELKGGGIKGLRDHELEVADKGIEQERVKAWGMANQGGVAAGIKAGVERDAGRAQHGYFDEKGNYVPGSTVHAAEATGMWKSELNENNWRNRKAIKEMDEEGKNDRKQKDLDFKEKELNNNNEQKDYDRDAKKSAAEERTQRIRERQKQQDALREQRDFEAFEKSVGGVLNNPLTQEQKKEYRALKTPEERKTWWKSHFGRGDQQTQGGAPKEGDRKQFKQGWGTWKDGKWVLDAQ